MRRNQSGGAGAGTGGGASGTSDCSSRRGTVAASALVLPPIAEERLLDKDDYHHDDDDDDDDGGGGGGDDDESDETTPGQCCRHCCERRDLEAPAAWRDLDLHGVRCMLPARRRPRGCLRVVVRRYSLSLHLLRRVAIDNTSFHKKYLSPNTSTNTVNKLTNLT